MNLPGRAGPRPGQLLGEALDNLRLSGRRALLALLGIVVGSASIIALLNIGASAAEQAVRSFQAMGSNTLVVSFPAPTQHRSAPPPALDLAALHDAMPDLVHIAPITPHSTHIGHFGVSLDANLVGSTSELAGILGLQMQSGRFLSRFDQLETFAVVGAQVAEQLAKRGQPINVGDLLQLEGYLFQVIGIAESLPANGLFPVNLDDSVVIPIQSLRRLGGQRGIGSLMIQVTAQSDLSALAENLRQHLSTQLKGREVEVQIPQHLLDGLKRQARTFSWLLAGLGGITLLVAGVGVMNVMLMNVTERRLEIGLRMALGARPQDIRNAFLCEAVCLSLLGALVGALLGLSLAWAFVGLADWPAPQAPESLPLGIGSSLLIGVFFGLHPALSAARLQPVEALRDA